MIYPVNTAKQSMLGPPRSALGRAEKDVCVFVNMYWQKKDVVCSVNLLLPVVSFLVVVEGGEGFC